MQVNVFWRPNGHSYLVNDLYTETHDKAGHWIADTHNHQKLCFTLSKMKIQATTKPSFGNGWMSYS